jgi:hypothetical protein
MSSELISILSACQSPDNVVRREAELKLKGAEDSSPSEFYTALAAVFKSGSNPMIVRQLAGLKLKNAFFGRSKASDLKAAQSWALLTEVYRSQLAKDKAVKNLRRVLHPRNSALISQILKPKSAPQQNLNINKKPEVPVAIVNVHIFLTDDPFTKNLTSGLRPVKHLEVDILSNQRLYDLKDAIHDSIHLATQVCNISHFRVQDRYFFSSMPRCTVTAALVSLSVRRYMGTIGTRTHAKSSIWLILLTL